MSSKPPKNALIAMPEGLDRALGALTEPRKRVGRKAASEFSSKIKRGGKAGQSYADLLSRVYAQVDELVSEIETRADPVATAKRAEALKSVGKLLPLLQQAEKNARVAIKRKALEDMTDAEVESAARAALDSPQGEISGAVVPALAGEPENPILPTSTYIDEDDL